MRRIYPASSAGYKFLRGPGTKSCTVSPRATPAHCLMTDWVLSLKVQGLAQLAALSDGVGFLASGHPLILIASKEGDELSKVYAGGGEREKF